MRLPPRTWVALVVAHLVASAAHFGDNVARFGQYPEPFWLTAGRVAAAWGLLAALALLGARGILRQDARPAPRALLAASALLGVAGLGHYLVPGAHPMDPLMHALVWAEAAASGALLAATLVARRAGP